MQITYHSAPPRPRPNRISHHDGGDITCGLSYIMQRIGQNRRSRIWAIAYVQQLVDERDFPPPYPLRIGAALTDKVTGKSRWARALVDNWFQDWLPPATAAREDAAAARTAAEIMDTRAAALGLRTIAGGRS